MSFQVFQQQAYFIEYRGPAEGEREYFGDYGRDAAISDPYRHLFCGSHDLPSACCPNCERPLLRFAALDTGDPRLSVQGVPFRTLSLLYCWRCPISAGLFSYRTLPDDDVLLLQYERGAPETDFPYEDYPPFFPGSPARLIRITDEAQQVLRQHNAGERIRSKLPRSYPELLVPRHQYGGEPLLVQQDTTYRIECPVCRESMPFLASIGTDCLDPRGFVDDEYVQVLYHYCRCCHVVAAFNQCG